MENALLNDTAVNFLKFDITQTNLYDNFKSYDIIVSNPPYITEKEKITIKNNVIKYEPHYALFVPNDDPLKFYKYIGLFAKTHLKNQGEIYLEINSAYSVEINTLFHNMGFKKVLITKDLNENNRFVKISNY